MIGGIQVSFSFLCFPNLETGEMAKPKFSNGPCLPYIWKATLVTYKRAVTMRPNRAQLLIMYLLLYEMYLRVLTLSW